MCALILTMSLPLTLEPPEPQSDAYVGSASWLDNDNARDTLVTMYIFFCQLSSWASVAGVTATTFLYTNMEAHVEPTDSE